MLVQIKAFAYLQEYLPVSDSRRNGDHWVLPEGTSLEQTLRMLNIPQTDPYVLLVNDRLATREEILQEGDILQIIPTVCGG